MLRHILATVAIVVGDSRPFAKVPRFGLPRVILGTMPDLHARTAVKKARHFLAKAKAVDPRSLDAAFEFTAELEAAIVYARSSLDHLARELTPKHRRNGYKQWHQQKWTSLKQTKPVFNFLTDRRDYIIHEQSEQTVRHITTVSEISISATVSVSMTIKRADGSVEERGPTKPPSPPKEKAAGHSRTTFDFRFADPDWKAKPAVDYVQEFIELCNDFISDAESRFL